MRSSSAGPLVCTLLPALFSHNELELLPLRQDHEGQHVVAPSQMVILPIDLVKFTYRILKHLVCLNLLDDLSVLDSANGVCPGRHAG